ncbi:MAG: hypothetical protein MRY59_04350 [Aquisalinus sp.]|nr:hypothetical protein [Aquisalinus sp.]
MLAVLKQHLIQQGAKLAAAEKLEEQTLAQIVELPVGWVMKITPGPERRIVSTRPAKAKGLIRKIQVQVPGAKEGEGEIVLPHSLVLLIISRRALAMLWRRGGLISPQETAQNTNQFEYIKCKLRTLKVSGGICDGLEGGLIVHNTHNSRTFDKILFFS